MKKPKIVKEESGKPLEWCNEGNGKPWLACEGKFEKPQFGTRVKAGKPLDVEMNCETPLVRCIEKDYSCVACYNVLAGLKTRLGATKNPYRRM